MGGGSIGANDGRRGFVEETEMVANKRGRMMEVIPLSLSLFPYPSRCACLYIR
jgi:hypothetical protein